jgi:hypothetical protein
MVAEEVPPVISSLPGDRPTPARGRKPRLRRGRETADATSEAMSTSNGQKTLSPADQGGQGAQSEDTEAPPANPAAHSQRGESSSGAGVPQRPLDAPAGLPHPYLRQRGYRPPAQHNAADLPREPPPPIFGGIPSAVPPDPEAHPRLHGHRRWSHTWNVLGRGAAIFGDAVRGQLDLEETSCAHQDVFGAYRVRQLYPPTIVAPVATGATSHRSAMSATNA